MTIKGRSAISGFACGALLWLLSCMLTAAQTFTTLKHLNEDYSALGGLLIEGDTIYGTALNAFLPGAVYKPGVIFKINTDGSGYNRLTNFNGGAAGSSPDEGVVKVDGNLYGTTRSGGDWDYGTLYRVGMDGSSHTVLWHFSQRPSGRLITDGTSIYGSIYGDYPFGGGKVFKIKPDGTGFVTLKTFSSFSNIYTNADGANPNATLALGDGMLYGCASRGGNSGAGVLFKVTTNGTGFTVIKHFANSNGVDPSGLLLVGNVLYGTTAGGGASGYGTVFKVNTDGTDHTIFHYFAQTNGALPRGPLVLAGSYLYGTTPSGGIFNHGTAFKVRTNGTGFSVIKHFDGADGESHGAGLTLSGHTLFGTTGSGGNYIHGTIFKIELSPPLYLQVISNAVVLSWTDPEFMLQFAPAPSGSFTNVAAATSPYTNVYSASQMFFRLIGQ